MWVKLLWWQQQRRRQGRGWVVAKHLISSLDNGGIIRQSDLTKHNTGGVTDNASHSIHFGPENKHHYDYLTDLHPQYCYIINNWHCYCNSDFFSNPRDSSSSYIEYRAKTIIKRSKKCSLHVCISFVHWFRICSVIWRQPCLLLVLLSCEKINQTSKHKYKIKEMTATYKWNTETVGKCRVRMYTR